MLTETQNPKTSDLDQMDTVNMLHLINQEDQKVAQVVQTAIPQIALAVDAIRDQLAAGGRLFYVGAGTSGRLGLLDAVECVPTFGVSPQRVQGLIAGGDRAFIRAVEGAEDDHEAGQRDLETHGLNPDDIVVGIAASGRTPYVLGALAYARELGVTTIGLSCNDPAPLLDAADIPIGVVVGAEVLTGSTRLKAGTAQKLVLNMLSTAAFAQLGKVYGNLMVDVQVTNQKLAARARRIIQQITAVDDVQAAALLDAAHNNVKAAIVMHHRDVDYDTALALLERASGHLRTVLETEENQP